jgi:hypothetical protein
MGPEAAEVIKNEDDFSDPDLYLGVFHKCLKNEETGDMSNTDLLTVLSLYSQALRSEIPYILDEETRSEVDSFISFSLQEKFKKRQPNRGRDQEIMDKYMIRMVEYLENL